MIPVFSREQMRAFDAHAIEIAKVPSLVLMENAGRGAADVIAREALGSKVEGKSVVVVCGTGNNGGDGFVVARHLLARGASVVCWLAGDAEKMSVDCKANHDAFLGVGGKLEIVPLGASTMALLTAVENADVVVDAIFGTGLDRKIVEPLASVVNTMRAGGAFTVALDVPSGMNADTGAVMGVAVRARMTVTFAHPKLGHLTGHGARLAGNVHVVDIGVPPTLRTEHSAALVETKDVRDAIHPRAVDMHKYRAGHVAIMAGSTGKVGASLLCAQGALRAGAGAATIVTWADAVAAVESRVVEVMTARIEEGDLLGEKIDAAIANKKTVVIGPGFGTGDRARAAVSHVLASFTGTIVADADALTVQKGAIEEFGAAQGRAILTPHAGELARLLEVTSEEVENDRFHYAREAAARSGSVILLKGPHTIVAAPDGRLAVNASGNASLATAGSGDVLAGIVGALACSLTPYDAAWCGAWLHGAAGDAWKAKASDRGLLASEIADHVPLVLRELLAAG